MNTGIEGKVCKVNDSVTFSGIPTESEEFLNRMVEALGIIIDKRPKGRPRKRGKLNYRKNRMCFSHFNYSYSLF